MKRQIEINSEVLNNLQGLDLQSWMLVQRAYQRNCSNEKVMCAGMNLNTGYVYIALENGVQIASCFAQPVDFIITDFNDGEEFFFDTYEEAIEKQNNLN